MDRKAYSAAKKIARVMLAYRPGSNVRLVAHASIAFVDGGVHVASLERLTAELELESSNG